MIGTKNRHIYEKKVEKPEYFKSHSFPILVIRITNAIPNNPSHTVMKEIITLLFCRLFFLHMEIKFPYIRTATCTLQTFLAILRYLTEKKMNHLVNSKSLIKPKTFLVFSK